MTHEYTRAESSRVYLAILEALKIGDSAPVGARERALEARAFQWTHDSPEDYALAHRTADTLCDLILDAGAEPESFAVDLRDAMKAVADEEIDSVVCINALLLLGCESDRADPRIYSNAINAPRVSLAP